MIPNLKSGASFRGAQLYYLHDKRKEHEVLRLSDQRVAWSATRNCAGDDVELAFEEMIATANDALWLKMQAGERLSGRAVEKPVLTCSLSWHPSQTPDRAEMERAADSYLKHMGWQDHQAVYLCHTDTAHPHMHIVLNRVHPETGKVLDDAFSKNRSQIWARAYEHEHGQIWCEERIGKDYNHANDNAPRSMPHEPAIDGREAQQNYAEREDAQRTLDQREKEQLAKHHQDEREAFFDSRHQAFREVRQHAYQEVRQDFKPQWVEHFRDADQLRKEAQHNTAALAVQVLHHAANGEFDTAWDLLSNREALARNTEDRIAEARNQLRTQQLTETRQRQDEACAALYQQRGEAYTAMKLRQKDERAELKELQADRSAGDTYDNQRLIELVTEPVATRLPDLLEHAQPPKENMADAHAPGPSPVSELAAQLTQQITSALDHPVREERGANVEIPEREPKVAGMKGITGTADALAGGIGKLAEILADAIGQTLCPETPKEKAQRLTAQAKEKPSTPKEPAQPQGGRTSFSFDAYFGEHGARIRSEQDEFWRNRREENDNRNER